jgi:lysophosphatidate acyltransferase
MFMQKCVWVFPEARRSYSQGPDLFPFKKGAFHLATGSEMPVIPIVACDYSDVIDWQERHFGVGGIFVKGMQMTKVQYK